MESGEREAGRQHEPEGALKPDGSLRTLMFLEREELLELHQAPPLGEFAVLSVRSPIKTGPNEDGALIVPLGERRAVLAVADGVGGQPSAQRASCMALQALERALMQTLRDGGQVREAILTGIEAANEAVIGQGTGSATTLVVVELDGPRARTYHVGDSRVIVFDTSGHLQLLTIAHSPVGYAVEAGVLAEEDAIDHEQRHLVSNVIGDPGMHIEMSSPILLGPGDTLVAATDGLFDNLLLPELVGLLRQGPLEARVRELARECLERMLAPGGPHPSKPDDLTLIAFRPTPPS